MVAKIKTQFLCTCTLRMKIIVHKYKVRIYNICHQTGFVGALPHLLMTVIVPLGGMLADYIRKKGIMTTTNVRKVFNCGGFGLEALFFIVVAYSTTAFAATTALTFGVAFSGFAISGTQRALQLWLNF